MRWRWVYSLGGAMNPATKDSAPGAFALLDRSRCPARKFAWLEPNLRHQATELHVVYDSGRHTVAQLIAVFRKNSDIATVARELPTFPEGWWESKELADRDGMRAFE